MLYVISYIATLFANNIIYGHGYGWWYAIKKKYCTFNQPTLKS